MRSILKREKLIADPLAQEYIRDLGKKLASESDNSTDHFNFFAIDNPVINAFAGPDGHIGIYSGLILTTETESELAAVVAHEISHVTQHHLMRSWSNSKKMTIPQIAVLAAAVAIGMAAGADAGIATAMGGQAAIAQNQINFIRNNEKEADRVGIKLLHTSGFEPNAMPVFFERMGRANQSSVIKLPEYLRTHPVTTSRIADSISRADQYDYRQHEDNIRYHLLRASLKEKGFKNPQDAIIFFSSTLKDGRYRNRYAEEYGLTLAYLRNEEFKKASQNIDKLLKEKPVLVEFIVTAAQIETNQRQYAQAIKRLKAAHAVLPFNLPIAIRLAEAHLLDKQPKQALALLQKTVRNRPYSVYLHKLLSKAANASGDLVASHDYLSQHYYLLGKLKPAIQQLKIALKTPSINEYDAQRIEAKLESFKLEEKELNKDKDGSKKKKGS